MNNGDLGNSDIIDGGAGTDTLFAVINTGDGTAVSLGRPVISNVETVEIELVEAAAGTQAGDTNVLNLDKSSGIKTVAVKNYTFATTADTTAITGVTKATSLKITDDAGHATARANNFTVTYDGVSGTADSASVEISSTVAATVLNNITVAGVETLTVSSTGGAGAGYKVVAADATTLNLNASAKSGGAVDLAGAKIATLNINAADDVTVTDAGAASAKLRTVNIDSQTADKTVTLTSLTPTMTSTAQDLVSEAFTVNVQGAGKAIITAEDTQFGTQSDTNADSFVVAAGSNSGGVTATLSSMTTAAPRVISVTGGSGNGTVTVAAGGLDKYDTIALGAGDSDTLAVTAAYAGTGPYTSGNLFYSDSTAAADMPVITGVEIAKITLDDPTGAQTVDTTSAAFATVLQLEGDTEDSAVTFNKLKAGQTVKLGATLDLTDDSSVLSLAVKDATSSAPAASLNITSDLLQAGANAWANIDDLRANEVTAVTLSLASADADVLEVKLDGASFDKATTVTVTSAEKVTVGAIDAADKSTLDFSGVTAETALTVDTTNDYTVKGSATAKTTFTMSSGLDADDVIVGGSATTDALTATVTSLTATTGALHISGVETLEMTNTGTAVVNLAGVTGATNVALAGAGTATTLSNLSAGTKVTLGANTTTFTGAVTVGLADATGSSDSLTIDLNGAGTRGTATLTTTGIETLVLNGDSTYEAQTVDVGASTATTITVTGGHATPAAITLSTLNAATNLVDASAFTGAVVAAAATNTATTIKVRSSTSNDITGSVLSDTVIVGTAAVQAAGAIAHSNEIDGGAGTDTLTVYAANGADLGAADNFEVVNVIVDAAANATIDLGGTGQGADDAATITVTGGAAGKTLALTEIVSDIGARTIDASGVASTTTLTLGDNVLVQTNAADAIVIKGGSAADDVLDYTASNDDSGEVTISGFETIQVTNGNSASTLNLKNVTGASNIVAVGAGQLTISNFSNTQKIALGTYVGSTATAFSDGTGDTLSVSRAANGTADILNLDLNTTAVFTVTDNQAETVNLTLVDTAGNDDHSLTLSSTTATTVNVTGTGTAEDLTLTAAGALLTTVDASALVGNFTYDVSNRAAQAMTITAGTGNDTIGMTFAADVLDGGSKTSDNDTLKISFSGTGGALIVDLSSSTDQVQMFNGLANAAVQKNFESVNASAYVQTNSVGADITGSSGANTIVGTAYADTIRAGDGNDVVTGGAGADAIDVGAGTDTIIMAAFTDSFNSTSAIDTTAAGGVTTLTGIDVIVGLNAGDTIDLSAVDGSTAISDATVADGTTELAAATAGGVAFINGNWDAATQKFTETGTYAAGTSDDYIVIWADGTNYQAIILSGVAQEIDSLVFASAVGTLTT